MPELPVGHKIIPLTAHHWPDVRRIYGEGIATGHATFETELPDWDTWNGNHRQDCRLVATATHSERSEILGWAALSPVSKRKVYAGVAEVSVYVASAARGRGVGSALLEMIIRESESNGVWTLQAGIFPENQASISLHQSCGFRKVGVRQRIGRLGAAWRDVLLLERRSALAGV